MPLLDHFHPPLDGRRHWKSFHAMWASSISDALNFVLPEDFFAEVQVRNKSRIEADITTLAPADLNLPAVFPPVFGVHVYETSGGPTLVAAIELVSPGNKDRDETRRAFTAKCAALIQAAIGVIVIDIVTSRRSEPFRDLMAFLYPKQPLPELSPLLAASFRPTRVNDVDTQEIRHRPLAVGDTLPVLPLALGGLGRIDVNFEATYEDARSRSRL